MTPAQFEDWLRAMNLSAGEAAKVLRVHPNTITRIRQRGGDYILGLACTALYHRLEAWKSIRPSPPGSNGQTPE